MDKSTDFFYKLPEMMREEQARSTNDSNDRTLKRVINTQKRLWECMYGLAERIDATNELLHAICPAMEVISTIYETDQECREAIRRYMNLATDSDNMEDLIGLLEDDKVDKTTNGRSAMEYAHNSDDSSGLQAGFRHALKAILSMIGRIGNVIGNVISNAKKG